MRANWTAFTFNKGRISTRNWWTGDLMAHNFRVLQAKKRTYWHAHIDKQIKVSYGEGFTRRICICSKWHGHKTIFFFLWGNKFQKVWAKPSVNVTRSGQSNCIKPIVCWCRKEYFPDLTWQVHFVQLSTIQLSLSAKTRPSCQQTDWFLSVLLGPINSHIIWFSSD